MNINGKHYRTIWLTEDNKVKIINQQALPHKFEILDLCSLEDTAKAIKEMFIRGAGLIGAAAAYGIYFAALKGIDLKKAADLLINTRPTAVNLAYAVNRMLSVKDINIESLRLVAQAIADEDAQACRKIGLNGIELIKTISKKKNGDTVNILTHCNAGWLAFVDYGSALSPVYAAFDSGIDVKVWVDETRPRNQGAGLTCWELLQHGVKHELISDNAGGHLMQHGMVDIVITGADRVTRNGDAANKIGTYLKALAAKDNNIPFYVALPSSTFDFNMKDGIKNIPIEERDSSEVKYITGINDNGKIETVRICPEATPAGNWGFDVTPANLITGFITERGICSANEESICSMYPKAM